MFGYMESVDLVSFATLLERTQQQHGSVAVDLAVSPFWRITEGIFIVVRLKYVGRQLTWLFVWQFLIHGERQLVVYQVGAFAQRNGDEYLYFHPSFSCAIKPEGGELWEDVNLLLVFVYVAT